MFIVLFINKISGVVTYNVGFLFVICTLRWWSYTRWFYINGTITKHQPFYNPTLFKSCPRCPLYNNNNTYNRGIRGIKGINNNNTYNRIINSPTNAPVCPTIISPVILVHNWPQRVFVCVVWKKYCQQKHGECYFNISTKWSNLSVYCIVY